MADPKEKAIEILRWVRPTALVFEFGAVFAMILSACTFLTLPRGISEATDIMFQGGIATVIIGEIAGRAANFMAEVLENTYPY